MSERAGWAADLATFNRKYNLELKDSISVKVIGASILELWMGDMRIGTYNPFSNPPLDLNGYVPKRLMDECEYVMEREHRKSVEDERKRLGL